MIRSGLKGEAANVYAILAATAMAPGALEHDPEKACPRT
jgi:hypothetical protein